MTQDPTPDADRADTAKAARAIPLRPDGWPDWLGRRPMSNSDRAKIRQLRHALDKLIAKHGWTTRNEPR